MPEAQYQKATYARSPVPEGQYRRPVPELPDTLTSQKGCRTRDLEGPWDQSPPERMGPGTLKEPRTRDILLPVNRMTDRHLLKPFLAVGNDAQNNLKERITGCPCALLAIPLTALTSDFVLTYFYKWNFWHGLWIVIMGPIALV